MRTTVRVSDELLIAAKRHAVERGSTLTAVFEEALREMIERSAAPSRKPRRVSLPTFRGRGPRPGVDLYDSGALLDAMEVAEDARP